MREGRLKKQLQRSVALTSVVTFLMMPVNVAYGANNITAGQSGVGSLTQITGGKDTVTNITSGFIQNGTGINHFQDFVIGTGGTANLRGADAVRFVNMVNTFADINGVLNAFKAGGNLPANVMFISPEGMAIGASGVLNVAGLQVITPSHADYNKLIEKAGTNATNITLTEADFANLKAGGTGYVSIDGKIYSTDDVVIQAGNGIYFQDGGIINTRVSVNGVSGIGDISLFTNTGNIAGSSEINIDASGNVVLSAKKGGIGNTFESIPGKKELNPFKETANVLPLNIKVAEGKKLSVEVADSVLSPSTKNIQGRASVVNHSINLDLGTVKGANVEITNQGHGTLTNTEAIADVNKLYLNAANGVLNIENDITAKEIIRTNGSVGVEAEGKLNVTDAGYISVYSGVGDVNINDATLKSGNINITAKQGDVTYGNLIIQERGQAEGVLGLKDNQKLSVGEKAPDTFRFDGVYIDANQGSISQNAGTKIDSAGRVYLTANESIDSTIKAVDEIHSTGKKITLNTLDTARLGIIKASELDVNGENILIDNRIDATGTVDINATDKVTIRPKTYLDETHRTYGLVVAKDNVNVNAENGIFATEQVSQVDGVNKLAMFTSTDGDVNLNSKGDIKALGSDGVSISVSSKGNINATGKNINLQNIDSVGNIGTVKAQNDANISGVGKLVVNQIVEAGNNLTVEAVNNIEQVGQDVAFKSGNDMTLKSSMANVGQPDNYLTVSVGKNLDATANNGGVYINGKGKLNVTKAQAGKDVNINATQDLTANNVTAGTNVNLSAVNNVDVNNINAKDNVTVQAGNNAIVTNVKTDRDVTVKANNDLTADNVKVVKGNIVLDAINGALSMNEINALSLNSEAGFTAGKVSANAGKTVYIDNTNGSLGVFVTANEDITAGYVVSGEDIVLNTKGNLIAEELRAVADIELNIGKSASVDYARAQNNVIANVADELEVGTVIGVTSVDLTAGSIAQSTKDNAQGIYSYDLVNLNATSGDIGLADSMLKVETSGELNAQAKSTGANVNISTKGDVQVGTIEAAKDVVIAAEKNILVKENIVAGNDLTVNAEGYVHQVEDGKVSFKSGNDMTLTSKTDNVGDPNKYLQVSVGGELDAVASQGGVYIGTADDLVIGKIIAASDVVLNAVGSILQSDDLASKPAIEAGSDISLTTSKGDVGEVDNFLSVDFGGDLSVKAEEGSAYIEGMGALNVDDVSAALDLGLRTPESIVADKVSAGRDLILESGKEIEITKAEAGKDVSMKAEDTLKVGEIKAGEDIRLESGADMTIAELKANKDAEIVSGGKVVVEAKLEAGEDLKVEAKKDIEQEGKEVAFKSGNDMTLKSEEANVGQPDNYLSVEVGGKLDAEAPEGGVYINGNEEVTIGTIEAGKDVEIEAGQILQDKEETSNGIKGGEDVTIKATAGDIGAKDSKLKVEVGGELNAEAKTAGANVNIATKGEVEVGTIEAAKDVNIEQDGDLVIKEIVKGGNDVEIVGDGSIQQVAKKATKPAISAGNDMTLVSNKEDIGAGDNYLSVQVGRDLETATPNGDTYIEGIGNLNVTKAEAGKDVDIKASGNLIADSVKAENGVFLHSDKNTLVTNSEAGNIVIATAAGNTKLVNVKGGNYVTAEAYKNLDVENVEAGKDINLNALETITIHSVKAGESVSVETAGDILEAPSSLVPAIDAGKDITLSTTKGSIGEVDNKLSVKAGGELDATAMAADASINIETIGNIEVGKIEAGKDVSIKQEGNLVINDIIKASNNVEINGSGSILQAADKATKPAIEAGSDISLTTSKGDVGEVDNFLSVDFGGDLSVKAEEGSAYIEGMGALNVDDVSAALDLGLRTPESIVADKVSAGRDLILESGKEIEITKAEAGKDVSMKAEDTLKVGEIKAGEDIRLESGADMTIAELKANKDAEIVSGGKVVVEAKLEAGEDLKVEAKKDIEQEGKEVAFKSGNDMTLKSEEANVGQPDNYLSVEVGGKLDAEAPAGGVYINGNEEVTIGTIEAGKDVEIEAGQILQDKEETSNGIKGGDDVTIKATAGDIGAEDSKLKVEVGGELNAEAKTAGANVNIATKGEVEVGTIEAAKDVNIEQDGDLVIKEIVKGGNDVEIVGDGSIQQVAEKATKPAISAGNDMTLVSNKENVGAPDNYLSVEVGGKLDAEAPAGGVYIEGLGDLTVNKAEAGSDINIKTGDELTVIEANAGKDINLESGKNTVITDAQAGNDLNVKSGDNVTIENLIQAGNDLIVDADGYVHQTKDGEVALKSGNDMALSSKTNNVGDPNNYLQVEVGGELDATAPEGGVYIGSPSDLTINNITAATDAVVKADGYIHQTDNGPRPAITTGNDLTLESKHDNVGDPDNYLTVKVGGELDATAPEGGVYIEGQGDLNIDKVVAGEDVGLKAEGNIHQVAEADPENPRVISGGDMKLESETKDVGDPNNYLQVTVGGQLDATAPEGGVYIGSKENITIGQIEAGTDVGIETDGYIHQTDNGPRPAITAGDDLHLVSNHDNVGDPDNYLTVKVGGELDAHAPEGGVYIEGYGDITVDKIEAGDDVVVKGDEDIILPHDKEDGNIEAGGDVVIEAGDSVLNDGGENPGIIAGGDIDITANTNENEPAGTIGELPYDDLKTSINVIVGGEVTSDEIGVPELEKVLNIHIIGQDTSGSGDSGSSTDNGFQIDDRDQRAMKYLNGGDDETSSVRNNRQHLRYNVANSEYTLVDSSSESGATVTDIVNISKQGMLVETTDLPQLGERIQLTVDYKGLPFTVEGEVVRTDAAKNTAGLEFKGIDSFTSSMILYLGMMNGM